MMEWTVRLECKCWLLNVDRIIKRRLAASCKWHCISSYDPKIYLLRSHRGRTQHLWGIKFYDSLTNWTLVSGRYLMARYWIKTPLCGLNFLPSSKYSQGKMWGYYKEWMDDRPIEFSNKTWWIFSALMTQTRGFAHSLDMIARTILRGLGTSWRDSLSFGKFFAV